MKPTFFTILCSLLLTNAFSQNNNVIDWEWFNTYGNDSSSVANHIVVDDELNLYVAGRFGDALTVEDQTIIGHDNNESAFISKWNQFGELQWISRIEYGNIVNSIDLDEDNNLFVLVDNTSLIKYNGNTGTGITIYNILFDMNPEPGELIRNVKFNSMNELVVLSDFWDLSGGVFCRLTKCSIVDLTTISIDWSHSFMIGVNYGNVYDFALDANDKIYIAGTTYDCDIAIDNETIVSSLSSSATRIFTAKYTELGEAQWIDTIPVNFCEVIGIAVNSNDSSLYFTGYNVVEEIWYEDTLAVSENNQEQIFLTKYTTDGDYQWAKPFPVHTRSEKSFGQWGASGTNLQVSDSGYVYLKGTFTGSMIFATDTLYEDTTTVFVNQIADDVFLTKMNQNGEPIWGKYGGNGGGINNQTGDFFVDESGEILYMVGFDASPNNNRSVPEDPIKNIFIGREGAIEQTNFIEMLEYESFSIYPNPAHESITIVCSEGLLNTYEVVDMLGKKLLSGEVNSETTTLSLSELERGTYIIRLNSTSIKFIKL